MKYFAYVGEENAPVLNENLDNNAMTIDSSTIDYSKNQCIPLQHVPEMFSI